MYQLFCANGFYLRASPSYWDLMAVTDAGGVARSYLATEGTFAALKDLESRNLVVPVVGNFAGPKAIRWARSPRKRGPAAGTDLSHHEEVKQ